MKQVIQILHIVTCLLLIIAVLLQSEEGGLSSIFGGGGEVYRTKRGAEKLIFVATILLAIVFAITSILSFYLA